MVELSVEYRQFGDHDRGVDIKQTIGSRVPALLGDSGDGSLLMLEERRGNAVHTGNTAAVTAMGALRVGNCRNGTVPGRDEL